MRSPARSSRLIERRTLGSSSNSTSTARRGPFGRLIEISGLLRSLGELPRRTVGGAMQALALAIEPVFEPGCTRYEEALQQVAAIQVQRSFHVTLRDGLVERPHITPDEVGGDPDLVIASAHDDVSSEIPTQQVYGRVQRVPRVVLIAFGPEHGLKAVSAPEWRTRQREDSEQGELLRPAQQRQRRGATCQLQPSERTEIDQIGHWPVERRRRGHTHGNIRKQPCNNGHPDFSNIADRLPGHNRAVALCLDARHAQDAPARLCYKTIHGNEAKS